MTSDVSTNALLNELQQRGLIAQASGAGTELADHLSSDARVLYCGFDPTAGSLHIGHLVPLLMLKRFQQAGHTPLALIGGATGMIGDPSFKAEERRLNSTDQVKAWIASLSAQLEQILATDNPGNAVRIVNNADWTAQMNTLEFLRDVGKHFSVNAMINRESVRQRINRPDQGISFTEFSYSLLQAHDFAQLAKQSGCSLQIGGNDQWGNITAGIDLTRRVTGQHVFGITLPLITKSDGTKFGKTESGAIWLDPAKTSPYRFYQFWLNTADADVYRFLRYYSFLSLEEIDAIEQRDAAGTGKPQAGRILAEQVTRLVHGDSGLAQAERITHALFQNEIQQLSAEEFSQLALDGCPGSDCEPGITLIDALVESELAPSRRIAREHLKAGAISVNGITLDNEDHPLTRDTALHGRYQLIRRGRRQFHLLCLS